MNKKIVVPYSSLAYLSNSEEVTKHVMVVLELILLLNVN